MSGTTAINQLTDTNMRHLFTLSVLTAILFVGASHEATAANKTWDGGGANSFWTTGANWDANTAPSPGDSLFFGVSSLFINTNNFANNTAFSGITFNNGVNIHTLRGNIINFSGSINNLDDSVQIISLGLNLVANITVSADNATEAAGIAISGSITESGGSFGITKEGARALTLSGNNSFTGGLTINGGTVVVGSSGGIGSANAVSGTASGTLMLSGSSVTISGLTSAVNVQNGSTVAAATLTVSKASGTDTHSGTIQNGNTSALALQKTGAGTLVLSGLNSYSGGTTLSGGVLQAGSGSALGTGGVNFNGGTLNANNQTLNQGALTLTADSTLNLVDDGITSTITFSSASRSGGVLAIYGWSGVQGAGSDDDQIIISSAPDQNFLNNVWFDLNGQFFVSTMSGNELVPSLTPVPEPTEWALIIFATLGVLYKFVLPRFRKSVA
jgi:autotransporter-associated beta strand protein